MRTLFVFVSLLFAMAAPAATAPYPGMYTCRVEGDQCVVTFTANPTCSVGELKTWGGFGADYTDGDAIAPKDGAYRFPATRWFNFTHKAGNGFKWESVPNGRWEQNFKGTGCTVVVSDRYAGGLAHSGAALSCTDYNPMKKGK